MPLDVICPWCRECYFETNDQDKRIELNTRGILFRDFRKRSPLLKSFKPNFRVSEYVQKYDPERPANAAMIRLKDEFKEHIDDIPHDCDLLSEGIGPCPGCGNPLSNDNYTLITREQETTAIIDETDDYDGTECRYCGEQFPSSKGRIIHEKRWCKKRPGTE